MFFHITQDLFYQKTNHHPPIATNPNKQSRKNKARIEINYYALNFATLLFIISPELRRAFMTNKELLLIPGPTPVVQSIYDALSQETLGHTDPRFTAIYRD